MKIGLVSASFINGDVKANIKTIEKYLKKASSKDLDLICFGEAFLQGFDSLNWEIKKDLEIALSQDQEPIHQLKKLSLKYKLALSLGYYEKVDKKIYCSNIFISHRGETLNNYRRISPGWKEAQADNEYYKEGEGFSTFTYKNKIFTTAICGDLWHDPYLDDFKKLQVDLALWPLYIDYSKDLWLEAARDEYASRVRNITAPLLMINPFLKEKEQAQGGSCLFYQGKILDELEMGKPGILELNLD